MASSSDDNLDDSRKDDTSPRDKAPTSRKVSADCLARQRSTLSGI